MADTIKCPACSGNLIFDPAIQKLSCEYCGSTYLPSELEGDKVVNQLTEEVSYEENDSLNELICNSCGAALIADKNTSATFCTFCGSPALAVNKLTKEFKPKYIIPFEHSRESAVDSFMKWCKGGRMTPIGFVSESNIEKLTGLYVPYWLFSAEGHMDRKVSATIVTRTTSGEYQTTKTDYYSLDRKGNYKWENIPLDGETRLDDKLMEAIEPFNFTKMIPYDYKYIPGFYADAYDLDSKTLEPRAQARFKEYLEEEYKPSVSKYNSAKITRSNDTIDNIEAEYALLPVWFMNYKYLGKTYSFAMNGQTGEIAGVPPVSLVKRLMLYFLFLSIFTLIIKLIVGLVLGGYVG